MEITFSGKTVKLRSEAIATLARLGRPAPPHFSSRANSLWNPLGRQPARGWFLLIRRDLDALSLNGYHSITFAGGFTSPENFTSSAGGIAQNPGSGPVPAGNTVTLHGLVITATQALDEGEADAPTTQYLVEVSDKRWLCHNPIFRNTLTAHYNVRAPGWGGAYYDDSRNAGSDWTWETMAQDIWETMSPLGTWPGLPFSPDGTPEGFRYVGASAWEALCDVLHRIGCAVRCDLTSSGSQYTIVRVGVEDTTAAQVMGYAGNRLIHDHNVQEVALGRAPSHCKVHFHRVGVYGTEETTPKSSSQWTTIAPYTVDVATGISGAASVYHPLWDDLPALYDETGSLTNSSALATRAAERAADFARMLTGCERLHRTYAGILPLQPTSDVKAVCFRQADWPRPDLREALLEALRDSRSEEAPREAWLAFRLRLDAMLNAPTTTDLVCTEVVRHPWQWFAIGDDGRPCECEPQQSSSLRPPDYDPTFPVYPHLLQTIRIASTTPTDGLYDAYVERLTDAATPTWGDREQVWGLELAGKTEIATGRYLARLVGYEASRPVYAFRVGGEYLSELDGLYLYRTDCVGGVVYRYRRQVTLEDGALAVSAWEFDSFQGCCACSGSYPPASGSGGIATDCCPQTICSTLHLRFDYPPTLGMSPDPLPLVYNATTERWEGSGTYTPSASCGGNTYDLTVYLQCTAFGWFITYDFGFGTDNDSAPETSECDPFGLIFESTAHTCYSGAAIITAHITEAPGCVDDGPDDGGDGPDDGGDGGPVVTDCCAEGLPETLYITLVNVADCACIAGTYPLTWLGSGNPQWYYEGSGSGVCGGTDFDISLLCGGSSYLLTITINDGVGTLQFFGELAATCTLPLDFGELESTQATSGDCAHPSTISATVSS